MTTNNNRGITFIPSPSVETTNDAFTFDLYPDDPLGTLAGDVLHLGGAIAPIGAVGQWGMGRIAMKKVVSKVIQSNLGFIEAMNDLLQGREQSDTSPLGSLDAHELLTDKIGFSNEDIKDNNLMVNLCIKRMSSDDLKVLAETIQIMTRATAFSNAIHVVLEDAEASNDSRHPKITCEILQEVIDANGGIGAQEWIGDTDFFGWSGDSSDLEDGTLNQVATSRELASTIVVAGLDVLSKDKNANIITSIYALTDPMHDNLREMAWHKYPSTAFNISPSSHRDDARSYMPEMEANAAKGGGSPLHLFKEGLSTTMRCNGYITLNSQVFTKFSEMIGESTTIYPKGGGEEGGKFSHEEAWSMAIAETASKVVNIFGLTHAAIVNRFLAAYQMKAFIRTMKITPEAIKKHGLEGFTLDSLNENSENRDKIVEALKESVDRDTEKGLNNLRKIVTEPFVLNPVYSSEALAAVAASGQTRSDFISLIQFDLLPHLSEADVEKEIDHALGKVAALIDRAGEIKSIADQPAHKQWSVMEDGKSAQDSKNITESLRDGSESILDGAHYDHDWGKILKGYKEKIEESKKHEKATLAKIDKLDKEGK